MSLDIGVHVFRDGQDGFIPRSFVEQAFHGLTKNPEDELWYLTTPDGEETWGTLLIDVEPNVSGFSINRPPFFDEFLAALLKVLRQTPSVLWWPSNDIYLCAANPDIVRHAPPDFLDPNHFVMVSSIEDIVACMGLSSPKADIDASAL